MHYDLGYFDDETCRLEPIENPDSRRSDSKIVRTRLPDFQNMLPKIQAEAAMPSHSVLH